MQIELCVMTDKSADPTFEQKIVNAAMAEVLGWGLKLRPFYSALGFVSSYCCYIFCLGNDIPRIGRELHTARRSLSHLLGGEILPVRTKLSRGLREERGSLIAFIAVNFLTRELPYCISISSLSCQYATANLARNPCCCCCIYFCSFITLLNSC